MNRTTTKKYDIPFSHGVMFHHFTNHRHPAGQGAITAQEFEDIIHFIGRENILNADQWYNDYINGTLEGGKICLTFDDALKCQYEVAKPVLDKFNIKAFFFVYSSPLMGNVEPLEVYRFYRTTNFNNVEEYYDKFFSTLQTSQFSNEVSEKLKDFNPKKYLEKFAFYTDEDRKFRFVRDKALGPQNYNLIMDKMIEEERFVTPELFDILWMNEKDVKTLNDEGHTIGLHSFTHPTALKDLPLEEQKKQYDKNKKHLESLLNIKIETMSHPCNSYTSKTLEVLEGMDIHFGFRANMETGYNSSYEIPREDHINVLNMIKEQS